MPEIRHEWDYATQYARRPQVRQPHPCRYLAGELAAGIADHQIDGASTVGDAVRQVHDYPLGSAANEIGKEECDRPLAGLRRNAQVAPRGCSDAGPDPAAGGSLTVTNGSRVPTWAVRETWLPATVM
jgi:hypothetical protein